MLPPVVEADVGIDHGAVHTACCTARIGGHGDHDFRRFAPDLDVKSGAACF
jgi:hypothetical protein